MRDMREREKPTKKQNNSKMKLSDAGKAMACRRRACRMSRLLLSSISVSRAPCGPFYSRISGFGFSPDAVVVCFSPPAMVISSGSSFSLRLEERFDDVGAEPFSSKARRSTHPPSTIHREISSGSTIFIISSRLDLAISPQIYASLAAVSESSQLRWDPRVSYGIDNCCSKPRGGSGLNSAGDVTPVDQRSSQTATLVVLVLKLVAKGSYQTQHGSFSPDISSNLLYSQYMMQPSFPPTKITPPAAGHSAHGFASSKRKIGFSLLGSSNSGPSVSSLRPRFNSGGPLPFSHRPRSILKLISLTDNLLVDLRISISSFFATIALVHFQARSNQMQSPNSPRSPAWPRFPCNLISKPYSLIARYSSLKGRGHRSYLISTPIVWLGNISFQSLVHSDSWATWSRDLRVWLVGVFNISSNISSLFLSLFTSSSFPTLKSTENTALCWLYSLVYLSFKKSIQTSSQLERSLSPPPSSFTERSLPPPFSSFMERDLSSSVLLAMVLALRAFVDHLVVLGLKKVAPSPTSRQCALGVLALGLGLSSTSGYDFVSVNVHALLESSLPTKA